MIKHEVSQKSPEWLHIRKGKISGTALKGLMGTPKARQDAIYDLIGERLKTGVDDGTYESPIDRGNRLEPFAVREYEMLTGNSVDTTGFCESDTNSFVGNSPDGLIGEDGAIEIKCPEHKNYIKYWLTNELPDEYLWQVVQYFVVNDNLKWLDFVVYNPDIAVHPIHIIKVLRDDIKEKILQASEKQKEAIDEINKIISDLIEF